MPSALISVTEADGYARFIASLMSLMVACFPTCIQRVGNGVSPYKAANSSVGMHVFVRIHISETSPLIVAQSCGCIMVFTRLRESTLADTSRGAPFSRENRRRAALSIFFLKVIH